MKMIMKIVKHFALRHDSGSKEMHPNWDEITVTQLWKCIYLDIEPYLLTATKMMMVTSLLTKAAVQCLMQGIVMIDLSMQGQCRS